MRIMLRKTENATKIKRTGSLFYCLFLYFSWKARTQNRLEEAGICGLDLPDPRIYAEERNVEGEPDAREEPIIRGLPSR